MRNALTYRPGETIGGIYEVHQCLTGGMGEVYLCLDRETHEPYALKTFPSRARLNPDARRAFEREITTWIALENHPNIVRCFSMNIFDGQPFMILEWVSCDEIRGNDLRSWIEAGPLDLRTALEIAVDILRGLAHAGRKQPGLVHCDLKPENILIGNDHTAKITDFGLARIFQTTTLPILEDHHAPGRFQAIQQRTRIVGTPAYMAPEQWRGEPLDARTDLYTVGCILYEMLTGHWIFEGSTLTGFRRRHLEAEIPRLTETDRFPPMLNTLFRRCLAKHPDDRAASADALLSDVTDLYLQQFSTLPREASTRNGFTAIDFNNRGSTYARLRYYDEALRDFDAAVGQDPAYTIAYINRGSVHAVLRHHEDALEDYTHALALDPVDAETYRLRGKIYADIGEHQAALADYTQAIRLEPTEASGYYWRGKSFRSLHKPDRALADFSIATMLNPEYTAAYYETGLMLSQQGYWNEALAYFKKAAQFGSIEALRQVARIDERLRASQIFQAPFQEHAVAAA